MSWAKVSRVRLRSPSEGTSKQTNYCRKRGSHGNNKRKRGTSICVKKPLKNLCWHSAELSSGLQEYTSCNCFHLLQRLIFWRAFYLHPHLPTRTHFLNKKPIMTHHQYKRRPSPGLVICNPEPLTWVTWAPHKWIKVGNTRKREKTFWRAGQSVEAWLIVYFLFF